MKLKYIKYSCKNLFMSNLIHMEVGLPKPGNQPPNPRRPSHCGPDNGSYITQYGGTCSIYIHTIYNM